MITGFNTDIEFEGVVYHVQTEDKGLATPFILSLVYNRGTILASKRAPYEDLLAADEFDENILAERLQRQHSLICAAVSKGRIEDLKQMSAADSASRSRKKRANGHEAVSAVQVAENGHDVAVIEELPDNIAHAGLREEIEAARWESTFDNEPEVPKPAFDLEPIPKPELEYVSKAHAGSDRGSVPFTDEVRIFEDDSILPSEAVEIISDLAGSARPANNKLTAEFLGESRFKGGEDKTVTIMVCRGTERKVVGDAEVMVKVLGSSFRPLIFHARTDSNGIANVHMHLPHFQSGRAKMLVRAMSSGEEVELRRVISHG